MAACGTKDRLQGETAMAKQLSEMHVVLDQFEARLPGLLRQLGVKGFFERFAEEAEQIESTASPDDLAYVRARLRIILSTQRSRLTSQ